MLRAGKQVYGEFGIGLSLASSKNLDNRDQASTVNFRDVIGMGYRIQDWALGARIAHYSNGGNKINPIFGTTHNPGYTWVMLHFEKNF